MTINPKYQKIRKRKEELLLTNATINIDLHNTKT